MSRSSRIPGFYKLPIGERRRQIAKQCGFDVARLEAPLLDEETANHMVENVVAVYGLPLGIALNFQINGQDLLVPMCVEEPSVIAAASNAAKMIRAGGGFHADADDPVMISQVQLTAVPEPEHAKAAIVAHTDEILALANAAYPSLVQRGGGIRGIEVRILEGATVGHSGMLAVHLFIDCRDAMGANLVNTIAEAVAPRLAILARAQIGLRILSNLADRRCVRVKARVPVDTLKTEGFTGEEVRDGIVSASRFAELDPYRAATHNKGIMNGVASDGSLEGRIELPLAVGTVGGTLRVHAGARLALEILGVTQAGQLGMVMAAAGIASNLAALRALASEGIQRGHMSMHARTLALHVGATGDLVDQVAAELAALGDVRAEIATQILTRLRNGTTEARS